ncbi:DUF4241 domain-containing protein [Chryseobacterium indologenes]|uniref:DUF4241 domain-containing protein n=1 Tax=Chryseobacterium indologenes TaxID=253 RepID=UPI001624BEE9|nr:DUF4241 domain-containing protein [Chryseobacterium indologenes]
MNESWMQKWEEVKGKFESPVDLETYFTSEEIMEQKMEVMAIGDVSLPSGKVIVRDPLVYLNKKEQPYFTEVPKGNFPVSVAVVKLQDWGDRYAAVKVEFTKEKPVMYREALIGIENLEDTNEGEFFGFNVDAGLACITDPEVVPFVDRFIEELDVDNIYDDYFAGLFAESYKENPKNQRDLGDWINWKVPNTEYQIPIFASGVGDGVYPVYFAYDQEERICGVYIHFIDIELELSYEDEEDDDDEASDLSDDYVSLK